MIVSEKWSRRGGRTLVRVAASSSGHYRGLLFAGGLAVPCALGRSGIRRIKREGDGATPAGAWRLVSVLYRPDRLPRPLTSLPARALRPGDGWCDDPGDRRYNRPVRLPCTASHERLWRDDRLYDVIVVLDYNLARPRPGLGSAIFLHMARDDFGPTEGCVAIAPDAIRKLLQRVSPDTILHIQ